MEASGELRRLLEEQKAQTARLEAAVSQLEQTDLARKSAALEQQVDTLREQRDRLSEEARSGKAQLEKLREENTGLRRQLMEQIASQRSGILSGAKQQAHTLIDGEEQAAVNRLADHNKALRARLHGLRARLEGEQNGQTADLMAQIAALEQQVQQFMRRSSGALSEGYAGERQGAQAFYQDLEAQPISPGQVERKLRQGSLELKLGGRVTVVIGVFFMLLAVVFGLRYTFVYLLQSDLVKGLVAYLIGLLFVGGGELLSRRQRSVFSVGICAGGVSILFASTAVSYFSLDILTIPLALGICVAVTALALLLAVRYDAMLIAIFALIGGYLPMAAIGADPVLILSAMGYFLLLQLFVLATALGRRWQTLKFFSLIFGLWGVHHLLWLQAYRFTGGGVLYVMANFLLVLAIVLVYPILRRDVLRRSDTVLLGIATAGSCGLVFLLLWQGGYETVNGLVALGFCALFFLGAKWLGTVLRQDAGAKGLFYATAFAFWVLAVPLQFEPALISLGWLCEGVALYCLGAFSGRKWYRRAGGVLVLLCCASFLPYFVYYTVYSVWWHMDSLLVWRYGAVTLGALVIAGVGIYALDAAFWSTGEGKATRIFRYVALCNLWVFGLYWIHNTLHLDNLIWAQYWTRWLTAAFTLGLGVCYRAIAPIRDKAVVVIARVLYVGGVLAAFYAGSFGVGGYGTRWLLGLVLLMALDGGVLFAVRDFLLGLPGVRREWMAIFTAAAAIAFAVQLLMVQGAQGLRSMLVSFVLIAWALGLILFGFVRGYAAMRRCGLILSLLSVSKLFLLDLSFLPSGQRILSYFVFGIIFIGIAWVYQVFSKRFIPEGLAEDLVQTLQSASADDEENDGDERK